jgi:hypothetical protein
MGYMGRAATEPARNEPERTAREEQSRSLKRSFTQRPLSAKNFIKAAKNWNRKPDHRHHFCDSQKSANGKMERFANGKMERFATRVSRLATSRWVASHPRRLDLMFFRRNVSFQQARKNHLGYDGDASVWRCKPCRSAHVCLWRPRTGGFLAGAG